MKKKFKDTLFLLFLLIFGALYLVPAILEQKQTEWEDAGMPSILETLDADQDQEAESDSTDDEL